MDTRSIVMVAVAALVALTFLGASARADSTIKSDDASVQITVPNGWRQTKPLSPAIQIQVTNGRATILVRVGLKEDYKDLQSFAQVVSQRFTKSFIDAEPKFEDVQVNGKPAIRVSAMGTQSNGVRRGFVMTCVDTDGRFVEVVGIAAASAFQAEQQLMADMAGRVKVLDAVGAGPAAQMPAAPPPTGNTPATPPGRQPPTGRQPR
jgi:hypothetical protein